MLSGYPDGSALERIRGGAHVCLATNRPVQPAFGQSAAVDVAIGEAAGKTRLQGSVAGHQGAACHRFRRAVAAAHRLGQGQGFRRQFRQAQPVHQPYRGPYQLRKYHCLQALQYQ